MPSRCFFNVVADDPTATARFYKEMFGFEPRFTSDWFVHLAAPEIKALEIGILRRGHEVVPTDANGATGGMLTLVVDDVDAVYRAAKDASVPIVQEPRDWFYGQRRLVLRDPAGTIIDVSSECAPDPDWMARVRRAHDGSHFEVDTE